MKRSEILFGIVKVPLDFLSATLGFVVAYLIRSQTDLIPGIQLPIGTIPPFEEYMMFAIGASLALVGLFSMNWMYSLKISHTLRKEIFKVVYISIVWLMLIIAYFFIIREFFFSRLVMLYSWILATFFLVTIRIVIHAIQVALLKKGIGRSKVVFVGSIEGAEALQKIFEEAKRYEVLGVFSEKQSKKSQLPYLGSLTDVESYMKKYHVDEVVQTHTVDAHTISEKLLDVCRINHVRFRFVPDLMEVQLSHVEVGYERDVPLIEFKPTSLDGWGRVWKRTLDIVGSIVGMILLSPFIIGTAIAVAIQMKSIKEILFIQKRYGLHGKLFTFYKFQSMYVGAVDEHSKILKDSGNERAGLVKIKNDPRVTKVGRIIRKTSLDELPQLWNVLKGNMSLVGPRPHMPEEIDLVTKHYQRVLSVKPGITGLAQISGRSSLDFEDEMKLDMTYVENWSLLLDIVIILKTIWKIIKRENAS